MSGRIKDYSRQAARAAARARNEPLPPQLDDSHFYNILAQERFQYSLHKRAIIQEKQIAFEEEDVFTGVLGSLEKRHSTYMLQPPAPVSRTLVKEFYANLVGIHHDSVIVRRTHCRYDASFINTCLGVPDMPESEDAFWPMMDGLAVDWETIRQVIGVEDAAWEWYESHKSYPQHMKNKYLSEETRIWMKIIHSHLLPNSHSNTIPQDQCILLFCLVVGLPINLGKLIYENMRTIPVSTKACTYPSLITALLQRQNVPFSPEEALIPPPDPIKVAPLNMVVNMARKKVRRAIAAPRPRGNTAGASSSSQPPTSSSSTPYITRQEFEAAKMRVNSRYTSLYRALETVSAQVLLLMGKKKADVAPVLPPLDPEFLFTEEADEDAPADEESDDKEDDEGSEEDGDDDDEADDDVEDEDSD